MRRAPHSSLFPGEYVSPAHSPLPHPLPAKPLTERATSRLRAGGGFQGRKGRCFLGSCFLFGAINGVKWIKQPPDTAILFQILADPHSFYRAPQLFCAHKGHLPHKGHALILTDTGVWHSDLHGNDIFPRGEIVNRMFPSSSLPFMADAGWVELFRDPFHTPSSFQRGCNITTQLPYGNI